MKDSEEIVRNFKKIDFTFLKKFCPRKQDLILFKFFPTTLSPTCCLHEDHTLPIIGILRPNTSWVVLLLPAFQHQILDTHSFRGCVCCCLMRPAAAHHSRPRVMERVITDQIPASVTSSPYQGIGAFYEGWGGCQPLQNTSSPNKPDFLHAVWEGALSYAKRRCF